VKEVVGSRDKYVDNLQEKNTLKLRINKFARLQPLELNNKKLIASSSRNQEAIKPPLTTNALKA
jgi:hypothetical protein